MGYLVRDRKKSAFGGFIGGMMAYVPLNFLLAPAIANYLVERGVTTMSDLQAMLPMYYASLVLVAAFLALLGAVGGLLGTLFVRRSVPHIVIAEPD